MMTRKPSHLGSSDQPGTAGGGPVFASTGSGRRTARTVRFRRREREGLEGNGYGMVVARVSDDCGAVVHPDEPGAPVAVQHRPIWLKEAGRAKLHLQQLRAGDRVQPKRVHTRKVRQRWRTSC